MIKFKDINKIENRNKDRVFEYIGNIKKEDDTRPLRILDVGGGINSWLNPHVTHIIDGFNSETAKDNITLFNFDLDDNDAWQEVFKDVEENGKFDFVSSTHTLEDLNSPVFSCMAMNKIANAGYIAVPSKYAEFARFERCYATKYAYKGYHHHRWVYTLENDVFTGYPKQGSIEYATLSEMNGKDPDPNIAQSTEIEFLWEENFEFDLMPPWSLIHAAPPKNAVMMNNLVQKDDLSWDRLLQNIGK